MSYPSLIRIHTHSQVPSPVAGAPAPYILVELLHSFTPPDLPLTHSQVPSPVAGAPAPFILVELQRAPDCPSLADPFLFLKTANTSSQNLP